MTIAISGTTGITLANQFDSASTFGFKNRIINGAMVIDQRNAGAIATLTSASSSYGLDRYLTVNATDGTITYQQVVDAPSGFYNSTKLAVTTADASLSASQNFRYIQRIEANNLADFNLGTANAKAFTVSFWVKSSLTGNFAFSVNNYNVADQSYVTSYTINSANTWEQKTITIPAPTTGTFNTGTNVGLEVIWGLGSGTTFNTATQNQWVAANVYSFLGATSVVGTGSATWFVTGVQLEKGSTATSFDYRPYGTELQLCQRYYEKSYNMASIAGASTNTNKGSFVIGAAANAFWRWTQNYRVSKRGDATFTIYSTTGASGNVRLNNASDLAVTTEDGGENACAVYVSRNASLGDFFWWQYTASSEL